MEKQQRIDDVGKYIDKYYVPENDDIEVNDSQIKGFFDKISEYLANKKSCVSKEDNKTVIHDEEEDASFDFDSEFDLSTAHKTTIVKPVSETMVTNRKINELMSQMDETFSQRLLRMIRERGMLEAEVYKKAYVDRRHFSKIKKDDYYTPNKKTVLAFSIALELSLDETKDLLRSAGYALSRSSKFDIIVVYFIENHLYDMMEINDVLYEYGQPIFE